MKCKLTIKETLNSNNPEIVYQKAKEIKGIKSVERLENKIISLKNSKYIYLFALNIKGANKDKLVKAISKTKDLLYIYYFARNVQSLTKNNISMLEDKIILTRNPEYILMFARDVNKANIEKLTSVMIDINDYDWMISYMWVVNCSHKDICYLTMATRAIAYTTMNPEDKEKYWQTMHEIYSYEAPKRLDVKKEIKSVWEEIYDFIIRIVTFRDIREFIDFFKI